MPGKPPDHSQELNSEELLKTEFDYIARTAFQADEDRARVSSFYLVAVGSLVAALFSTQFVDKNLDPVLLAWAFSGLFFMLTILGTLTNLQLSRLRAAWYDSMLAMNQLKDYWIHEVKDKNIEKAFKWDTITLPRKYKLNSVSFYQTVEVALLSGLTFGASVYFFQKAIGYSCPACNWAYTLSLGILAFFFQIWIYKLNLGK
jgi:hypothetical protein